MLASLAQTTTTTTESGSAAGLILGFGSDEADRTRIAPGVGLNASA